MLRITRPSARSARMPTSLIASDPPRSFAWVSFAMSMSTSSGFAPVPSIWRLQRMHLPLSGIPWRSSRGGFGGGVFTSARPWM